jgi:hypothetical protein
MELGLHSIAFLGEPSPAGLQAFWPPYSVNRSPVARPERPIKVFLRPRTLGQLTTANDARATRATAHIGLRDEPPSLHRLKDGVAG